jgi:hypothetical protein
MQDKVNLTNQVFGIPIPLKESVSKSKKKKKQNKKKQVARLFFPQCWQLNQCLTYAKHPNTTKPHTWLEEAGFLLIYVPSGETLPALC